MPCTRIAIPLRYIATGEGHVVMLQITMSNQTRTPLADSCYVSELSPDDVSEVAVSLFELINAIIEERISKPKKLQELFDRLLKEHAKVSKNEINNTIHNHATGADSVQIAVLREGHANLILI